MKNLFSYLSSRYEVQIDNGRALIRTPIMYFGADHAFSFTIVKAGDGYTVSDGGQTLDYLRECTDADRYAERIMSVMRSFSITLDSDELIGFIPSVESGQTGRALHNYLLGVGIIANLYLI